jgi:uncharacterized protein involved in cysteine biosynthesis
VNLALGAVTLVAAARYWRQELASTLEGAPVVGWIFVGVMTLLGSVVLFILAQPILGAVFCDHLSEVTEKRVRGTVPAIPFLKSAGRAVLHGLLKLLLYGVAFGVGLALTAVTGVGSLVGVGLGAIFLAYDGFDYPLGRRGVTFGGKWAYLAKNPGLTLGYGLGTTLLYLVPLAFLVAPPFAAVGATLAYLDAETRATDARASRAVKAKGQAAGLPETHNPIDISAS